MEMGGLLFKNTSIFYSITVFVCFLFKLEILFDAFFSPVAVLESDELKYAA